MTSPIQTPHPVEQTERLSRQGKPVRLTLDIDPTLHLRLKLHAAQQHSTMREVAELILQQAIPDLDHLLASTRLEAERVPPISPAAVSHLVAVRKQIMRGRSAFTDESADLLYEARTEHELHSEPQTK